MPVPPALKDAYPDPQAVAAMGLQAQLFASRRAALHSELAALDESVVGVRSAPWLSTSAARQQAGAAPDPQ
ncbi:hypothetical protein LP419_26670 [Massilia sp. H-1]|nr:hypothetical protein LP419_26670 [Massilia sp. H-1]